MQRWSLLCYTAFLYRMPYGVCQSLDETNIFQATSSLLALSVRLRSPHQALSLFEARVPLRHVASVIAEWVCCVLTHGSEDVTDWVHM